MFGCVLRVCDPLSCVAVELSKWIYIVFYLLQVHFIRFYTWVWSSFKGNSIRFISKICSTNTFSHIGVRDVTIYICVCVCVYISLCVCVAFIDITLTNRNKILQFWHTRILAKVLVLHRATYKASNYHLIILPWDKKKQKVPLSVPQLACLYTQLGPPTPKVAMLDLLAKRITYLQDGAHAEST